MSGAPYLAKPGVCLWRQWNFPHPVLCFLYVSPETWKRLANKRNKRDTYGWINAKGKDTQQPRTLYSLPCTLSPVQTTTSFPGQRPHLNQPASNIKNATATLIMLHCEHKGNRSCQKTKYTWQFIWGGNLWPLLCQKEQSSSSPDVNFTFRRKQRALWPPPHSFLRRVARCSALSADETRWEEMGGGGEKECLSVFLES